MKRFWLLALVALFPTVALAINQSDTPPKFPLAWGANAGVPYLRSIPSASQIGTQNCAASLNDGFPPLTFVPASAGGCPPFGQDFNGVLKQITQAAQWQQAGGPIFYDSAFSTSVNGYPKGAILSSAVTPGTQWLSTADNNTTNPDSSAAAGWIQNPTQILIGTPLQSLTATVPPGYVSANGLTIGDASSNATNRANADTQFLFSSVWAACPNTQCPIFTSGGAGSSRGVSAAADYAAHKALAVQNMNAAALMGADSQSGTTTSLLVNVPVTSGSRTVPGSLLGENLHALLIAELAQHGHGVNDPQHSHGVIDPQHSHGIIDPGHTHGHNAQANLGNASAQTGGGFTSSTSGGATISPAGTGITVATSLTGITVATSLTGITVAQTGSNTPHNTVPRSMICYWNLKL
jgi:hypothetical protein